MNIINEIMTNVNDIIFYIATNPWIHIPIAIFIGISVISTFIRIISSNSISKKEESTEEDIYYKMLIEYGYSNDEIENIKAFNNEK